MKQLVRIRPLILATPLSQSHRVSRVVRHDTDVGHVAYIKYDLLGPFTYKLLLLFLANFKNFGSVGRLNRKISEDGLITENFVFPFWFSFNYGCFLCISFRIARLNNWLNFNHLNKSEHNKVKAVINVCKRPWVNHVNNTSKRILSIIAH